MRMANCVSAMRCYLLAEARAARDLGSQHCHASHGLRSPSKAPYRVGKPACGIVMTAESNFAEKMLRFALVPCSRGLRSYVRPVSSLMSHLVHPGTRQLRCMPIPKLTTRVTILILIFMSHIVLIFEAGLCAGHQSCHLEKHTCLYS